MNNFDVLRTEIVARSRSKIWDIAKTEWSVVSMENVEEPETCLCGHFPITEVLILQNKYSKECVRIGNVCVNKFIVKNNNFNGYKRICKDTSKSVNYELLEFAYKNNWISQRDFDFYKAIMSKRTLTVKQMSWKKDINASIISKVKSRDKNA